MTKHYKPGFAYRYWTRKDINKQGFVADAALDTYVERLLAKLNTYIAEGGLIADGVRHVFDDFTWFVSVADNAANLCGAHHHFNYVMLSNILTEHCENMYMMDGVTVHFDGTISTGE
jgi:hypothetical protein